MYKENPNTRGAERNAAPFQRKLLHPESFDPDKLTVSEIEQGDGVLLAKIPSIPNRITRRKKISGDGYYIELILRQGYDPETKQNRNKKVIIGEDISYYLKGMMIANDKYHDYFNNKGTLLPHILAMILEEERQKQKAKVAADQQPVPPDKTEQSAGQAALEQKQKQSASIQEPHPQSEEEEANEVQIKELRKREKALDLREERLNQREAELDELQVELENQQMLNIIQVNDAAEDHIKLLRDILSSHTELIEAQAKRRPDTHMSKNQIQTINEILRELRTYFQNSEIEDYLHLATEPNEETNTPATTYGEMSLFLNAYGSMLHQFVMGRLRTKQK